MSLNRISTLERRESLLLTKSIYEFWISQGKDKLRLPVLPEIDISNTIQNESVKVASFGEITFIDKPGAKEISFSSFFPKKHSPLAEYKGFPSPENAIAKIEKWVKSKKPVQFLITGTKINLTCSIEVFTYSEGQKDIGDRDYEIKLKEYKTASPRKIKQKKKTKKNGHLNQLLKHTPLRKAIHCGTLPANFMETAQNGARSGTSIKRL